MTECEKFPFADPAMHRVVLGIEYDGSAYVGWQRQNNGVSIQEKLEDAISVVANTPTNVQCAGRTDRGVHASMQVIHFDTLAERNHRNWILGINANLPKDIAVRWVKDADESFHARFSAVSRRYRYVILNQFSRSALLDKRVTWNRYPLDEAKMHAAAQHLVGRHDFSSYRAVHCQAKSPVRTLHAIDVSRDGDFVYIDVHGEAFLHHMVRNFAGVLMEIGEGHKPVDWSREVLEYRDRTQGGVTAQPQGLYLAHVEYPEALGVEHPIRRPHYNY